MRSHDSAEHDAAAELYDQAVEFWLRTLRAEGLLVTARKAVPLAQPCAYHVLVILNGVLDGRNHEIWVNSMLSRCAPTNFGMCVASLLPRWDRLPAEVMDTHAGNLLLDQGEEYEVMTVKCWFSDFGDFLDLHGEAIVLPELPRTPTPVKSESEAGSQAGRFATGQGSRQPSSHANRSTAGHGPGRTSKQGSEAADEDNEDDEESDEEDQWESMLSEENKKNEQQEAHIAWLEEQERLKKLPQRTPTPPPTKAEKELAQVRFRVVFTHMREGCLVVMSRSHVHDSALLYLDTDTNAKMSMCACLQVEEEICGRILVVFAETLEHLHEQCVLASRAGCIGVIVVGAPDAEFTLEEYKVLRSARSSQSAPGGQDSALTTSHSPASGLGNVSPGSRVPTGGSTRSPNGHVHTGATPRSPQTPASRRPSTREGSNKGSRPNTQSSRFRYGRVSQDDGEDEGATEHEIVTDGKNYLFFKIPIPVVWVTAEDAAYVSDGTMVSIYWHENLLIPVGLTARVEYHPVCAFGARAHTHKDVTLFAPVPDHACAFICTGGAAGDCESRKHAGVVDNTKTASRN